MECGEGTLIIILRETTDHALSSIKFKIARVMMRMRTLCLSLAAALKGVFREFSLKHFRVDEFCGFRQNSVTR
jgi:hypothetical protein